MTTDPTEALLWIIVGMTILLTLEGLVGGWMNEEPEEGGEDMSKCRTCGAEILWAKTPKGKNIPLDAKPSPNGNLYLIEGVAFYTGKLPEGVNPEGDLYLSHFATCPDSTEHRRKT